MHRDTRFRFDGFITVDLYSLLGVFYILFPIKTLGFHFCNHRFSFCSAFCIRISYTCTRHAATKGKKQNLLNDSLGGLCCT